MNPLIKILLIFGLISAVLLINPVKVYPEEARQTVSKIEHKTAESGKSKTLFKLKKPKKKHEGFLDWAMILAWLWMIILPVLGTVTLFILKAKGIIAISTWLALAPLAIPAGLLLFAIVYYAFFY